jgi:uncharacterized membrane protein YgcG
VLLFSGHYVPNLALEIYKGNKQAAAAAAGGAAAAAGHFSIPGVREGHINLQGFFVGNAWTDPAIDNLGKHHLWQQHHQQQQQHLWQQHSWAAAAQWLPSVTAGSCAAEDWMHCQCYCCSFGVHGVCNMLETYLATVACLVLQQQQQHLTIMCVCVCVCVGGGGVDCTGALDFWYSHAMVGEESYQAIKNNCDFNVIGPLMRGSQAVTMPGTHSPGSSDSPSSRTSSSGSSDGGSSSGFSVGHANIKGWDGYGASSTTNYWFSKGGPEFSHQDTKDIICAKWLDIAGYEVGNINIYEIYAGECLQQHSDM